MPQEQLHEDKFLQILWDEKTRIIAIDWKASTSTMTSDHTLEQAAAWLTIGN